MTYPVDSAGNPRVDFVWGNMAMQPNDQRDVVTSGPEVLIPANGEGNFGWDTTYKYPSEGLYASVEQRLSVGDKDGANASWDNVTTRTVSVPADNHSVALTGYSNYPAYLPNYAGDGDAALELPIPDISNLTATEALAVVSALGIYFNNTGTHIGATVANDGKWKSQDVSIGALLSAGDTINAVYYAAPTVPNVVGMTEAAATTALTNAHLAKGIVTTANNASGATALNDGKIKTQNPASGVKANTDSAVELVKYAYTSTANTNIAGFSQAQFPGHSALTGNDVYMFLFGRTTKPTVGTPITLAGNSNASLNQNFSVITVEDNDSYNTGGTVVKLTAADTTLLNPGANATIGTWINL